MSNKSMKKYVGPEGSFIWSLIMVQPRTQYINLWASEYLMGVHVANLGNYNFENEALMPNKTCWLSPVLFSIKNMLLYYGCLDIHQEKVGSIFADGHYKPDLLGIEHFPSMLTWKYLDSSKLLIFQLQRAQGVSYVGNIWIGPWPIFPHYMDCPFLLFLFYSINTNFVDWLLLRFLHSYARGWYKIPSNCLTYISSYAHSIMSTLFWHEL